MSKYDNKKKTGFLEKLPKVSLEAHDNFHAARCKFNFSYYCVQPAGQDLNDLDDIRLKLLFEKLCHYSKEPLKNWSRMPVGKSGTVLAIYGSFPLNSDFSFPPHVPHEAQWGRFRLDHSTRLIGFVVPEALHGAVQQSTGIPFDGNTFYIVFFDENHRFYKGKEEK